LVSQRQQLIEQGVVVKAEAPYVLTQSYEFNSLSIATGTVFGRCANGRVEWKTSAGKTLKAIQEEPI
jgi:hypothetical protein